jgi:very-short-patch-repair endonuclease
LRRTFSARLPRFNVNWRQVACHRTCALLAAPGASPGRRRFALSSFVSRSQARRKAQLAAFAQENRHSETESERILWSAIRGAALGVQFRRQVPIAGLFIGDFVASEIRLIIEVDGNAHARRSTADARRDTKLRRLGFTVLRLPVKLVESQLPEALQRIREAIAASSASP